jgi:hypothetical protein
MKPPPVRLPAILANPDAAIHAALLWPRCGLGARARRAARYPITRTPFALPTSPLLLWQSTRRGSRRDGSNAALVRSAANGTPGL